jgi:hypothetical protein
MGKVAKTMSSLRRTGSFDRADGLLPTDTA